MAYKRKYTPKPNRETIARRNADLDRPRTLADVNRDQAKEMEQALGPIKEEVKAPVNPTQPTTHSSPGGQTKTKTPGMTSASPMAIPSTSGLAARLKSTPVNTAPHIVVEAYAGTGKTFTQIVGVGWAFGRKYWKEIQWQIAGSINDKAGHQKVDPTTFIITPSKEQQAVWDAFAQSVGSVTSVLYCAFNKSIVTEFGQEWGWLVKLLQEKCGVTLQFATINSLGNRACNSIYGRLDVKQQHSENMLCEVLHRDIWELRKKEPTIVAAVPEMVRLCKLTLTGWTKELGFRSDMVTDEMLDQLASFYDVEMNGSRTQIFDLTRQVLELSSLPFRNEIDFDDQNWLPVINKLPVAKHGLVLVDEGQDLNRCKQEFCLSIANRICLVGDPNQAIYGFAGADTESIPRMRQLLSDQRETVSLRLTETRRCGKAIVRQAQRFVSDFRAHESNPEGLVRYQTMTKYSAEIVDGDMALCRVNAPLVSQALKLISAGRKAIIRGREFGTALIKFVQKMGAETVSDLVLAVDNWAQEESRKESSKRNPNESKLMAIDDRKTCIHAFCEESITLQNVIYKMEVVFAGKQCPKCHKNYKEDIESCYGCQVPLVTPKGVLFSSVHKAKGLEAQRVFILLPKNGQMPHPMAKSAWQMDQEKHLQYVADTRAIMELVYVTD